MKRKLRKWKMWAGYANGNPDWDYFINWEKTYGVVYPTRSLARQSYDDVRPVEVRELPRKKR